MKIGGSGLYAGELAVVEAILSGIIPAAMVRTDAGKTRRVRAVDLERVTAERAPAERALAERAPAERKPAESGPAESASAGG